MNEITKIMFTFNNINLEELKTIPAYAPDLSLTSLPTWAPVYRRKRQDYESIYGTFDTDYSDKYVEEYG